jgi:hypothetical protein
MNIFKVFLVILMALPAFAQERPSIGFEEVLVSAEENASKIADARKLTSIEDIPHTIFLPEGIFIEARGIEDGKVVYAIYNDLIDIYNNGESAFWEEIQNKYNLSEARLHFVNRPTQNPQLGLPKVKEGNAMLTTMLMVTNWTDDGVSTLNATTGDLLNLAFITDPTNLSSPKEANLAPWGQITVSDQIEDGVIEYDTSGGFLGFFAPAGGVNNAILDNVRGHNFRPNGNLVVTTAGGSNADAIAEFDSLGSYIGNFIANGAGGMDSPFDIVFRTNDCLVSTSTSDAVHRYDLNGTYLDDFATNINFAQQIFEMDNGNIAVAGFSTPSGIYIYSPTGTLLNTLSVVTGVRSVYQLPNGHLLTTSSTSLYEIDENTGAIIRTIASGLSFQYISLYDYSIIQVELTSFTANVVGRSIVLKWQTATELNNNGFQIERSKDNISFSQVAFVPGYGTTTEPKSYSFTDNSVESGVYYYRLKQIDFDGSYSYSDVVSADIGFPIEYALGQNYPNPFNPSTTIEFSAPIDAKVTIRVYNLVGELVSEIISGDYPAGIHNVDFNAADLTSGIYFYRIDAVGVDGSNYSNMMKMTLLK